MHALADARQRVGQDSPMAALQACPWPDSQPSPPCKLCLARNAATLLCKLMAVQSGTSCSFSVLQVLLEALTQYMGPDAARGVQQRVQAALQQGQPPAAVAAAQLADVFSRCSITSPPVCPTDAEHVCA